MRTKTWLKLKTEVYRIKVDYRRALFIHLKTLHQSMSSPNERTVTEGLGAAAVAAIMVAQTRAERHSRDDGRGSNKEIYSKS